MRKIANIYEYLRIVCAGQFPANYPRYGEVNENSANNVIRRDESIAKYFDLINNHDKNDKTTEKNGVSSILAGHINQHYQYIYTYKQQRLDTKNIDSTEKKRTTYFYRGANRNSYLIAPGIYRKYETHQEYYYFNEISVRCPEAFKSASNLAKLTYMQHYGCPTRLLDITSNPLIALFFACNEGTEDGSVYVFAVNENDVLYSNSDRVQMLSKLTEFKKKEQIQLRLLAYRYLLKGSFPQKTNGKYLNPIVEQYYHAIARNNAFERDIIPFDILKPQFIQPNKDNPRILKQDGAFIIFGLDQDENESDFKIRKYIVNEIVIDGSAKESILRDLEFIGINQATLFPEVEKVADYLRHRP